MVTSVQQLTTMHVPQLILCTVPTPKSDQTRHLSISRVSSGSSYPSQKRWLYHDRTYNTLKLGTYSCGWSSACNLRQASKMQLPIDKRRLQHCKGIPLYIGGELPVLPTNTASVEPVRTNSKLPSVQVHCMTMPASQGPQLATSHQGLARCYKALLQIQVGSNHPKPILQAR